MFVIVTDDNSPACFELAIWGKPEHHVTSPTSAHCPKGLVLIFFGPLSGVDDDDDDDDDIMY